MKESLSKLDPVMQKMYSENLDTVIENYRYLSSIGITNPASLIPYIPNKFLFPTELLAKSIKNVDIDLINEDPEAILEFVS